MSEEVKSAEGMDEWAEAGLDSGMEQSQIDNLFGDSSQAKDDKKAGVMLLLDNSIKSATRMPMLEIIFDRFIRIFSNSLRTFMSYTIDVEIDKINTVRFGDYIDSLPIPTMIAPFKAIEWDNFGLVVLDSFLIYSMIDVLFGGRKIHSSLKVEGRPYTSIERNIIQNITEFLLTDLSNAFEPVSPVTFQLDRLESNPKFATIARADDIAINLQLNLRMESRKGKIELLIPFATIEPIKKLLLKSFIGEKGVKDPIWIQHFQDEILDAKVTVNVNLNGVTSSIKNVASLKLGDTVILDKTPEDDLVIAIDKTKISTGKLGKVDDNVAIMLTDNINIRKFNN